MRGPAQYFWGEGAALLLVCPTEGVSETRGRRPRNIRCLMPQNKRFSFSLAGKMTEGMEKGILSRMSHANNLEGNFSTGEGSLSPLIDQVYHKE